MSYKLTQTGQRVQELLNQIENGGQSQVTDAVLYSEQALNEKEQAQARKNIGAAAENQIPTGAVLYSQQQNLTGDQQAQARTNIGVPNKVSELENDAHYITESQVPIALPQKTGAIQSGVLPTSGWSTFDKEWVQTTLPANRSWHDVAYGDGKYVAVAYDSDTGAYSTNGINWTEFALPARRRWYSVTYGNGKFVAVADSSNKGAYSTNGISWTEFALPVSERWEGLTYGDGTFVTVAHNSSVGAYSPDGITWTTTTLPAKRYWYSVTYGNGKFVAVAENYNSSACDKGAYSNDGINWVEVTLPARQRWRCVAYGGGKFVAMGLDSRYGAYSTDGINWRRMSLSASRSWLNITYGDGRFVSLASSSEKGAYSTDGINWVEFTLPSTEFWSGVTYGNDKFVAVASYTNKGASGPKVTYSIADTSITANSDILMELTDDGGVKSYSMEAGKVTVIRDAVPTQPIPYTYKVKQTNASGQVTLVNHYVPQKVSELENDAHYLTENQVPVALPQKTGVIQSGVLPTAGWSPFDGDWQETTMPWEQPWNDVAYGNGKFVAIAEQTSRGAYSEDGITWKQMNMPVSAYWSSIAYGNGKFVAVSYNNSTVSAYSLDGVNWTRTTMPASANWCSVIYGADKFVAVANPSNRAAYSLDGITWVETTMPSNSPWLDIAYGNNKFIVVSYEGGNLAYSNDGITWEQTTMFPYAGWRSVAYGNGVFVAVERDSNNAAYSSDGINWTMTKLPASGFWGHVVYGNGLFVATIGDGSAAAYSRDGINWTSLGKTTRDYWDVAYGDGKFVAVFYGQEGAYLKIAPGVVYTIRDNSITETSDVLMEVSDSGQIQAHGISKYNITIIRDTEPTASIPYTYKVKETNNQGQFTIVNNYFPDIPTKVSQLENDANYITESQVPTKISQFANDMDYATVGQIPTKVSQLNNDQNFTDNIGTITQIKINGKVKNPQPSGLIDLGNITPEPTDWTTVPITTALENGKTYVVKLDTTPYPLTAIFTMSEALDAIDANVVGGTQQGTDGASTYELQSATITVKDGRLTGLKSTNLVSNANPGAANLAYSESTFADLGITQYHYIELLNSVGGGMSGKGVNYTAIKDTLAIDKWTTDEIHVEGEILPTAEIVLVTFDDTVQHTIDKTKENTLLIGHATEDELTNIGYWAFDGQSLVVNVISSTDPDTNAPLQVLFSETTDTYFKYLYQESNTTLATLYVYKSNFNTYTTGDIVLVLSANVTSSIDWIKCSTLTPSSELAGMSAVNFYGYTFPSDLTGTSITIDVLCTKTDNPDIRKTLLMPYMGAEELDPGVMLHLYYYEPATAEEAQAFPVAFMAYVFTSNIPELAPAGTIIVFGRDQSSGSDPKYVFSKLFSLTTAGMAPVTYTYLNENIKLESAIKVYLNDSENIQIIDRQEGYVQFKRAKVADIPFSMEILDTEEEGLLRLFNSYVPKKVSELQNDAKYLTAQNLDYNSPISLDKAEDGTVTIGIRSDSGTAFAQYSNSSTSGTLTVDKWVEASGYYTYTISDYSVYNNTDIIMNVNTPIALSALSLSNNTLKIKAATKPTDPIDYSYKVLWTNRSGQFTIVNSYIPTKISELTNDSGFITQADIPATPTSLPVTYKKVSGELPISGWSTSVVDGVWTEMTLPATGYWPSVTYGNGKFVAIAAESDKGAYSADGISWTEMTMPAAGGWIYVTYGNGKFVAIAEYSANGAYSTDGITWTAMTLPASRNWYSVTYGDGKFVAIANATDKGAYSADGITWTEMTMPANREWSSVTYGNGKFVAVSDNDIDKGAYSADGITWTEMTLPSKEHWYSVTYGGDKFVVVGQGLQQCAYSTDGINWTVTETPGDTLTSVTYGGGKFVAVMRNTALGAYSTDGITWTEMTMPDSWWSSVTYGDGKFVAVAYESTNGAYLAPATGTSIYTISDSDITANTSVKMYLTDAGGVKAQSKANGSITVIRDTVPTTAIPYKYEVEQTSEEGLFEVINAYMMSDLFRSFPIAKTITNASTNVSIAGSASPYLFTVMDSDISASSFVRLYPNDADTETWLNEYTLSSIITESSGSFTFEVNTATLPSSFSIKYIIEDFQ